ncbi:MAG: hypothetical protein CO030_01825 [Candidatus Magasanikbacteria bacterium CG_4_9_14_0_2_um_filter_42_11]|uniref:Uncharacterized protein n=1 Tax=Candidatus Magasanikbacteria bacterium CG_4_9_14_0_2_um_filter_42_11 TaxID=1974643 RepID=A0A2M8FA88_9BACT|nr:MAG: hypothetical protein COU34_00790 [Candidatus Magasanikbacteria bacterium CG10_big_fil_rev_8_21_14_0_10_43_9]PIY92880.1 MAG: hypothetical protein COY70_00960 [Candidatus Magasanikbacteria bacterium CG_4_10_14_0_8_um_filter_42_12]PJC52653.1 MAG: hypothetical protein CO030_01825 [Candidatus Magasanikbacteria bacterium CG_4_9_14_0_2_um_filter_42_11]
MYHFSDTHYATPPGSLGRKPGGRYIRKAPQLGGGVVHGLRAEEAVGQPLARQLRVGEVDDVAIDERDTGLDAVGVRVVDPQRREHRDLAVVLQQDPKDLAVRGDGHGHTLRIRRVALEPHDLLVLANGGDAGTVEVQALAVEGGAEVDLVAVDLEGQLELLALLELHPAEVVTVVVDGDQLAAAVGAADDVALLVLHQLHTGVVVRVGVERLHGPMAGVDQVVDDRSALRVEADERLVEQRRDELGVQRDGVADGEGHLEVHEAAEDVDTDEPVLVDRAGEGDAERGGDVLIRPTGVLRREAEDLGGLDVVAEDAEHGDLAQALLMQLRQEMEEVLLDEGNGLVHVALLSLNPSKSRCDPKKHRKTNLGSLCDGVQYQRR